MTKTILITGATSGFGRAAAIALVKMGHTIIIGCRIKAAGEQAAGFKGLKQGILREVLGRP